MTSSMYNSIQHFLTFGTGKIEKRVKEFIQEQKDLADLVIGLQEELYELGRNIIQEVIVDMDEYLRESESRKQHWEIVRKDPTGILTNLKKHVFNHVLFILIYYLYRLK
jgi:hypothetical protein